MATFLAVGVWLGAVLLSTPRTAFLCTLGLVALIDLAALPARDAPEYDEREAFYRTDQVLSARVSASPDVWQAQPVLTLLVEPVFVGDRARFGLGGEVGGTPLNWNCAFQRGLQRLVLPVPPSALSGAGQVEVQLRLIGSPSRESEYLLVYASSARGGFLVSLVDAADAGPGATTCTPG
jgi:hypothetical protein